MNQTTLISPTAAQAEAVDKQIQENQKITDFQIREWPIEVLVQKFTYGLATDEAEIFIPDYQREFIWTAIQQSRFIESLMIHLPVPYMFMADVAEGPRIGNLEVIDGSQRIRTLVSFLEDKLTLVSLNKLILANGFKFSDFSKPRQTRFKRQTVRVIELTEKADEDARREMFDRLNSGGTKLVAMEVRRGTQDGPFMKDVIQPCAKTALFIQICPLSKRSVDRAEHYEFVLRFFAYADNYMGFEKEVGLFLSEYLQERNTNGNTLAFETNRQEFNVVLEFVKRHFPNGFRRSPTHTSVPRIRFEAIAVGVALALRIEPDLVPSDVNPWLESEEFMKHTRSDASNSKPKVVNRIHFVRDNLLSRPVEYHPNTKAVEESANADAPAEPQGQKFLLFNDAA
jgi:hypothetical protein